MFFTRFAGRLYRNLTELCTTSGVYCGGLRMKNTTLHVARSNQRDVEPTRRFPLLKELMAMVCGPKMYNPPSCVH